MVAAARGVRHSQPATDRTFPVYRYEASSGTAYGANFYNIRAYNHQYNMRFAANYVTGSHAFKFGFQDMWGTRNFSYSQNNSQYWVFFNGAPLSHYAVRLSAGRTSST